MTAYIDWLPHISELAGEAAVIGLLVTGALLVLARDWRMTLLALLAQYVLFTVVLSRMVMPEVALIKGLVGALTCLMLYLAARQSGWGIFSRPDMVTRLARSGYPDQGAPMVYRAGLGFRGLAATMVLVLAIVISQKYPLPGIPADVGLGSYWLILTGMLVLILTEEPLKAGPGLFTVIAGFELVYSSLEQSLIVVLMWAVINLSLAVAVAYLAAVRGVNAPEEDL